MHCNALQCTAMHCNALQCTAIHSNTLQHNEEMTPNTKGMFKVRPATGNIKIKSYYCDLQTCINCLVKLSSFVCAGLFSANECR